LKAAIRDNDPVIFMESEQMYGDKGEVPDGEYIIPIGLLTLNVKEQMLQSCLWKDHKRSS
jgi:pyruvate/2-oxoglutarate/acetoin dehydrogenase E1 component